MIIKAVALILWLFDVRQKTIASHNETSIDRATAATARATRWLAVFTFAAVVIAALQWGLLNNQVAEQAATDRGWLAPRGAELASIATDISPTYNLVITYDNTGKLPVFVKDLHVEGNTLQADRRGDALRYLSIDSADAGLLAVNETCSVSFKNDTGDVAYPTNTTSYQSSVTLTQGQMVSGRLAGVSGSYEVLYINGCYIYTTPVDKKLHHSKFCYWLLNRDPALIGKPRFHSCPTGGDAD